MDYTVVPLGLRVFPMDTYKDKANVMNWEYKTRLAGMGGGLLILAKIPEQHEPYKYMHVVDFKDIPYVV